MPYPDSNRRDSTRDAAPSLWANIANLFKRTPVAPAAEEPMPAPPPVMPLPPAPAPAPTFLKLQKGQGTMLRNALNPDGSSEPAPEKIPMMEMPRHSSVLPRIVLNPAKTLLKASRTMLSALRKAPPPRPVNPEPTPAPETVKAKTTESEKESEARNYPII